MYETVFNHTLDFIGCTENIHKSSEHKTMRENQEVITGRFLISNTMTEMKVEQQHQLALNLLQWTPQF